MCGVRFALVLCTTSFTTRHNHIACSFLDSCLLCSCLPRPNSQPLLCLVCCRAGKSAVHPLPLLPGQQGQLPVWTYQHGQGALIHRAIRRGAAGAVAAGATCKRRQSLHSIGGKEITGMLNLYRLVTRTMFAEQISGATSSSISHTPLTSSPCASAHS